MKPFVGQLFTWILYQTPQRKCECYWPEKFEEPFSAGHDVTVKLISKIPFSEFVLRKMMVERVSKN